MRRRYLLRAWRSERGSQGLEAAGAALAAALVVLALLAGARSTLGPRVAEAFQCAAAALGGGGGCGDTATVADGTGTAPQQQQQQRKGGFGWLDGLQLGLDAVGLVPGLGEVADGVNGLIALARGDKTGAALSFAAMVPFAGWAATGGKFVRTGIKYGDEVAGATRYSDEAANAGRRLPCVGSAGPPSGKGPGLAKPLFSCVNFDVKKLQAKFKHAADFGVSGNFSKANAEKFQQVLEQHIASPQTQVITGTYRGNPVQHHFDPTTGLNVIVDTSGEFVSGWRLSPDQIKYVTTTGNLGGG